MEDQRVSPSLYAREYSQLKIIGTRFLTFRDVPNLINTYVNGSKTLDYGCGPGHSTTFLKSLGLNVEGVDINKYMIRLAKELDPDGSYNIINSGEIPTQDEYYDLVYAGFVLIYVSTKCELLQIVQEVSRVLKPNGIFIALVTNENSYKHKWLVEKTDYEENKNLVSGSIKRSTFSNRTFYHYFWSDKDYRGIIEEAGLKIVCAHRPLGKTSDGFPWIDEMKVGPSTIYVAKKVENEY